MNYLFMLILGSVWLKPITIMRKLNTYHGNFIKLKY